MASKIIQRLALSLVLFAALFSGSVLSVSAAGAMTVTVVDVAPGSMVRLQFANLPKDVPFAIMMGVGGKGAAGAPTVAHIASSDGGVVVAWFEILTELSDIPSIDVRVDNGAGLSMTTNFKNFASPVLVPVLGAGGAVVPAAMRTMNVVHVQKGGTVTVAISGLPDNTHFLVSEDVAGTKGFGGYVVGHLDTVGINGADTVSTFEIAYPLRDELSIDLRLEGPSPDGIVYFVNFKNVDK